MVLRNEKITLSRTPRAPSCNKQTCPQVSTFWPKAVKAACDIGNRLPHTGLKGKTRSPYCQFFKAEPFLKRFKNFGSTTFAHIPEERRPKQSSWNDRPTNGVLVGYPSSTTYEYYDFENRKFLTSHDIDNRDTRRTIRNSTRLQSHGQTNSKYTSARTYYISKANL
jgi:hypothetical protein